MTLDSLYPRFWFMNDMSAGWVGVDLDCTLAVYPHNFPGIGPPIDAMVRRVKALLAAGVQVRIFTARVCLLADDIPSPNGQAASQAFVETQRVLIDAWSLEHIGQVLPVTNLKDFNMIVLLDDRCVQVESNTGKLMNPFILNDVEFD